MAVSTWISLGALAISIAAFLFAVAGRRADRRLEFAQRRADVELLILAQRSKAEGLLREVREISALGFFAADDPELATLGDGSKDLLWQWEDLYRLVTEFTELMASSRTTVAFLVRLHDIERKVKTVAAVGKGVEGRVTRIRERIQERRLIDAETTGDG